MLGVRIVEVEKRECIFELKRCFSSHRWKDLNNDLKDLNERLKFDYRTDVFRPLRIARIFSVGAFQLWFTSHATAKAFRFSVKVNLFLRVFPQSCIKWCSPGPVFKLLRTCSSCELLSLLKGNREMLMPKVTVTWDDAMRQLQFWKQEGALHLCSARCCEVGLRKGCISLGLVLPSAFIDFGSHNKLPSTR